MMSDGKKMPDIKACDNCLCYNEADAIVCAFCGGINFYSTVTCDDEGESE